MSNVQESTTTLSLDFRSEVRRCDVVIGRGALGEIASRWQHRWTDAALIGDERVLAIHGPRALELLERCAERVVVCSFPQGEASKTRATKEAVEDRLIEARMDRSVCVVALGGGVSLDLAGFVAATYLRGVDLVCVPTSLLAQVDASVGGKTAVNTSRGKNLVGAFHQPSLVIVDPALLDTLPDKEWGNGWAEAVKHAVVADRGFFDRVEVDATRLASREAPIDDLVRRCVEIKAAITTDDERERGRRSVLNFGHTLGHALEAATGHRLPHGRAVAIGMIVEARVARAVCGFPADDLERLVHVLDAFRVLPSSFGVPFPSVEPFLSVDKKRRGPDVRMALPLRIGVMAGADEGFTVEVSRDEVERAYRIGLGAAP